MKTITIDIDGLETELGDSVLNLIKKFEIKPVNCDECEIDFSVLNVLCRVCKHNRYVKSCFKPKRNELDKLFDGAPIMLMDLSTRNKRKPTFNLGVFELSKLDPNLERYEDYWMNVRLPTVEEAPRNVWLVPWLEMPEEFKDTPICVRKGLEIWNFENGVWAGKDGILSIENGILSWEDVEAVMIMGDFKK